MKATYYMVFILCAGIGILGSCSKPELSITGDRTDMTDANPEVNLTIQADIKGKLFAIKKGVLEIYKNNVLWGVKEDILESKTFKRKVNLSESGGNDFTIKAVLTAGRKADKEVTAEKIISAVGDGNNTFGSAETVFDRTTKIGYITYPFDVDYYVINCTLPGGTIEKRLDVTIENVPTVNGINYDLLLYNEQRELVSESHSPMYENDSVSYLISLASNNQGNYYMKVYPETGYSADRSYRLNLRYDTTP